MCSIRELGHLSSICGSSPIHESPNISEPHKKNDSLGTRLDPSDELTASSPAACPIYTSTGHPFYACPARIICSTCHFLGHTGQQCNLARSIRMLWKPNRLETLMVWMLIWSIYSKQSENITHLCREIFPRKGIKRIIIGFPKAVGNPGKNGNTNKPPKSQTTIAYCKSLTK